MLALLERILQLILDFIRSLLNPPPPPTPPPPLDTVDFGNYDAGSILSPDPRKLDFGTITAPLDPRRTA